MPLKGENILRQNIIKKLLFKACSYATECFMVNHFGKVFLMHILYADKIINRVKNY